MLLQVDDLEERDDMLSSFQSKSREQDIDELQKWFASNQEKLQSMLQTKP